MGKFFNAFEKFEKERIIKSAMPKLRQSDCIALLQYDRKTGKLDLFDREIVKDIDTPQRLLDNNLISPDGKLTSKGLIYCQKQQRQ